MTEATSVGVPSLDLHEQVLARIGPDLVDGVLVAGQVLRTEGLESRYGVSRTVIREVVKVLESLQMVTSRRRVGVRVRPRQEWNLFDPRIIRWRLDGPGRAEQLRLLSELRRGIEPIAAQLAAVRATPEHCGRLTGAVIGMSVTGRAGDLETYLAHDVTFHQVLLEASGNEMFAALAPVAAEVLTGRTHHDLMPARPSVAAIRLHGDVAQAVASGSPEQARRAMNDIVEESMDAMDQLFPAL
jgi:DNA-binding FadR family transcriptional regulator